MRITQGAIIAQDSYDELTTINYLVNSYMDLLDVVETVEGMIAENVPIRQRSEVKRRCRVAVMPLKSHLSSHIMRFVVPSVVLQTGEHKTKGRPEQDGPASSD